MPRRRLRIRLLWLGLAPVDKSNNRPDSWRCGAMLHLRGPRVHWQGCSSRSRRRVLLPLDKLIRKGNVAGRLSGVGDPPPFIELVDRPTSVPNSAGPQGDSVKRLRSVFINSCAEIEDGVIAEVLAEMF